MHTIEGARLKPGVAADAIAPASSTARGGPAGATIRGRALIIWDLKVPGKRKKLEPS